MRTNLIQWPCHIAPAQNTFIQKCHSTDFDLLIYLCRHIQTKFHSQLCFVCAVWSMLQTICHQFFHSCNEANRLNCRCTFLPRVERLFICRLFVSPVCIHINVYVCFQFVTVFCYIHTHQYRYNAIGLFTLFFLYMYIQRSFIMDI